MINNLFNIFSNTSITILKYIFKNSYNKEKNNNKKVLLSIKNSLLYNIVLSNKSNIVFIKIKS